MSLGANEIGYQPRSKLNGPDWDIVRAMVRTGSLWVLWSREHQIPWAPQDLHKTKIMENRIARKDCFQLWPQNRSEEKLKKLATLCFSIVPDANPLAPMSLAD